MSLHVEGMDRFSAVSHRCGVTRRVHGVASYRKSDGSIVALHVENRTGSFCFVSFKGEDGSLAPLYIRRGQDRSLLHFLKRTEDRSLSVEDRMDL